MTDPVLLPDDDEPYLGHSLRRRRQDRRRRRQVLVGVVILLAVGAGSWLWLRRGGGDGGPGTEPVVTVDSTAVPTPPTDASSPSPFDTLDLPELADSDGLIQELARGLSSHPEWTSWMVGEDLARRFVEAVVNVSRGSRPATALEPLAPREPFQVREADDGRTVIDPASHRRYDWVAESFTALDPRGTARLYRGLHPLFEEAHQELGFPEGTFDDAVERAVSNVLAVRIPDGPLEVVDENGAYAFRDPDLENRSPAAKQLLRMGPDNARRIQAKVRELAAALQISTDAGVPGAR